MRHILLGSVAAILLHASSSADASNENGEFMTGGGAGSTKCPQFMEAMATARQHGGIQSPGGVTAVQGYMHYVLGFQTGYNLGKPGVYNVFGSLHENAAGGQVLIWIDSWCAKNPEKPFDFGIFELLKTLRDNSN